MIRKLVGLIMFLMCLFPLLMFLAWWFMPEKKLNILILDKTVLDTKTQGHISLSWILTNEKYCHSKTGVYDNKKDYFGFFPNDSGAFKIKDFNGFSTSSLDSLANVYNAVYFTDLYGIYDGEWYEKYPTKFSRNYLNQDNSLDYIHKIYGGMTQNEFLLLKIMKEQQKLIITEFNVIASPTPTQIRLEFESEFNLRWTGWVGRYYECFDTIKNKEIPRWMKRNYLLQHNNNWPFYKSGIVFIKNDEQIEILENKTHLIIELPIIHTCKSYMAKYDLSSEMKYPFWFDIINTNSRNKIVSTYKISTNNIGKKMLHKYGIPETFPAVIEHDSTDYKFYYFSGDFCDNPINISSAKFKWIDNFNIISYKKEAGERISFFWDFYKPLLQNILLHN